MTDAWHDVTREGFIFQDKHTESHFALSSVTIRIFFSLARAYLPQAPHMNHPESLQIDI